MTPASRTTVTRWFNVSSGWHAAGWYAVLTLALTWPLATDPAASLPSDLGDPVFICWALARAADHWLALLSGDTGAIVRFWNAGLFYPEPLATAFSEHFAAHALEVLPLWAVTRNVILCYNVLFFGSFVLGGLGTYLLTRDITGNARAAFVAGLVFAFTPYRFATLSHLQVLSSHWMPFALLGLRRYIASGRRLALAGASGALVLQNLSSGYYLIYFAPFAAAYAVAEMVTRGVAGRWRLWRDLVIAAASVLLVTLPFAVPYLVLQRRFHFVRPVSEIEAFSADGLAWLTAAPHMNLWGWLQAFPKPEGLLFPGLAAGVLCAAGLLAARRREALPAGTARLALWAAACMAVAVWMAMGPTISVAGHALPLPAVYDFFYAYVPGFDVSRAPARLQTIVMLFAAVLAACGCAWLDRSGRRRLVAAAGVVAVLDGAALPMDMNLVFSTSATLRPPPDRVYPEAQAPALWRYLATLPPDAVLAHLPFGVPEYEIRYLYYSNVDGHPMVNGYSGAFPPGYVAHRTTLADAVVLANPAAAAADLRHTGVTHVIVHRDAWNDETGDRIVAALEGAGLHRTAAVGGTVVLGVDSPGR